LREAKFDLHFGMTRAEAAASQVPFFVLCAPGLDESEIEVQRINGKLKSEISSYSSSSCSLMKKKSCSAAAEARHRSEGAATLKWPTPQRRRVKSVQ